ncbi:MAG TPA: NAD(P)-binding protein [Candidatus Limnocylindria bacterium]|nr:NAD(P)-binding protein [Candidatus Limnocylindria bacterium]
MAREVETVIIGGGIAGLACARRLHDGQRPFLLITEDVGGRIRVSRDGAVNVGAYYVRSDYTHVNQFVDRGRRIKRRHLLRGNADGSFTRSDAPLLLHLPEALRFLRLMRRFRRHYEAFKQDCLQVSQAKAIRADPVLWDLYHEPASRFVERHRIEEVTRSYLAPAVRGTAFTSVDRLTAFTLLVGVLDFVLPIFEFTFRPDVITQGFGDALLFDSVTEVTPTSNRYSVRTRHGGSVTADNVVVATPTEVSARLLDLGPVKSPIPAHILLVRGALRRPWAHARISLFPPGDPLLAIARQTGGSTIVSSTSEDPDLARVFTSWEVLEHHHWDPAFHLLGDALLECEQQPGLYLVGDHNACDLEDACITGIHAANRILAGHV